MDWLVGTLTTPLTRFQRWNGPSFCSTRSGSRPTSSTVCHQCTRATRARGSAMLQRMGAAAGARSLRGRTGRTRSCSRWVAVTCSVHANLLFPTFRNLLAAHDICTFRQTLLAPASSLDSLAKQSFEIRWKLQRAQWSPPSRSVCFGQRQILKSNTKYQRL
jgi:hypothetical protein